MSITLISLPPTRAALVQGEGEPQGGSPGCSGLPALSNFIDQPASRRATIEPYRERSEGEVPTTAVRFPSLWTFSEW